MGALLNYACGRSWKVRRAMGLSDQFRIGRTGKRLMSPALRETVARPAASAPDTPIGDLFAIWESVPEGHKWLHYFDIYEKLFSPWRGKAERVLEIGVYRGASLAMWRKYFHPDCTVVGIDIDSRCRQYERQGDNLHVRIGSQADPEFLDAVIAEFGPFDVIIDDGSHMASHMLASFNHLFDVGLRDRGLYMVEDLHCAYWPNYRDAEHSFVDYAKLLVDLLHAPYFAGHGEHRFREGGPDQMTQAAAPRISTMIDELRFFDSIVAIGKRVKLELPVSRHR